jgi:hypothetical protein
MRLYFVVLASILATVVLPPPVQASYWQLRCSTVCDAYGCYWTCATVYWPYYQRLTIAPDFCLMENFDSVWIKFDAGGAPYEWWCVPADDLTSDPPGDFPPLNWTVTGVNDGPPCQVVP